MGILNKIMLATAVCGSCVSGMAAEKAAEEARLAEEKANANTLLLQEILQVLKNK